MSLGNLDDKLKHIGHKIRMLEHRFTNQPPDVRTILAFTVLLSLSGLACRSVENDNAIGRDIAVITAPATGEVTRILTAEGVHIVSGAPVIEIAVQNKTAMTVPSPGESAEVQAVRDYKAADAEINAARAEAVRHEAEVGRLTPLVASGEVSQGQLDGEQALYEKAQRRLQQAQDAKRRAEGGLIAARQPGLNRANQGNAAGPGSSVQFVSAVASAAGTVAVISVRVGDKVKLGQPLATMRTDQ